ncbi:hypothetical protein F5Y16DRAFT_119065 [Xylariaceae sp. FL0255]|nr:hypothetical protein F5Y16DRAFT_119065 [Xylariaceae sp. FL0255]
MSSSGDTGRSYEEEATARYVERLSSIQENTEYSSSRPGLSSRSGLASRSTGSISTMLWPFHHRNASESQSTSRSSRQMRFRSAQWQPKNLFRYDDDNTSIAHSIVPDYVINFMRGETPESLARKKEAKRWGERNVLVTPNSRDSELSHAVELGFYESSSTTNLTDGINSGDGKNRRRVGRHFIGWRGGIISHIIAATLVLIVAITSFIILVLRVKAISASVVVHSGDCTAAGRINIGLHAIINVAAVVLLAGANYAFQVLTSPTRPEVSAAHDQTRWLDIGVASLRNLRHISGFRAVLGAVALLSAVTVQIIYNAVINLEQNTATTCTVNASVSTLAIGALLNIALIISMVIILMIPSFHPLATTGDAIRSFLQIPDHATINASLLSRADLNKGSWHSNEAKPFDFENHHWFQSSSLMRLILTLFSWLTIGATTIAALAVLVPKSKHGLNQSFGTPAPETTFSLPITIQGIQSLLIAVLPQLLLGILYLSINAFLSTLFLSYELSLFAIGPRPLRVSSNPSGAQIASLYLSLPRPVSWFLLAIFSALGLVLSQAVFPINSPSTQDQQTTSTVTGVAFNVQALLVLIVLLGLLLIFVFVMNFRQIPAVVQISGEAKGNPLAMRNGSGYCSAVISSQCHHSRGEGDLWHRSIAWGVVDGGSETRPGRCAFTANAVGSVDAERRYK